MGHALTGLDAAKAKVPFLKPQTSFLPSLSSSSICVHDSLQTPVPNLPPCFPPLHSHSSFTPSDMTFFRRWLPARLVAGPPRRCPWIGTPSRPHLPSLIVLWPSGEAHDIPSHKRPRIPLTTPFCTIRARVQIYGRTHILGPSTKMVTAAGRRFSKPWRLPKTRTWPQKKIVGRTPQTRNAFRAMTY